MNTTSTMDMWEQVPEIYKEKSWKLLKNHYVNEKCRKFKWTHSMDDLTEEEEKTFLIQLREKVHPQWAKCKFNEINPIAMGISLLASRRLEEIFQKQEKESKERTTEEN